MYQIIEKMQLPTTPQTIFSRTRIYVLGLLAGVAFVCVWSIPISAHALTDQDIQKDITRLVKNIIAQRKVAPPVVKKKTPTKKTAVPAQKQPANIPERQAFFPAAQPATATSKTNNDTPNTPQGHEASVPLYTRTEPKLPNADIEARARSATVNIVCVISQNGVESTSMGSGLIISPDGIILTNAHVGIYSLFPEQIAYDIPLANCVARMGSPARYAFPVDALYVPRAWVDQYASKLFTEHLKGTGAGDYMLLKRRTSGSPLWVRGIPGVDMPTGPGAGSLGALPYISPDTHMGSILPKDIVLGGGYPAEFLGSEVVRDNLNYAASYITVGDALTFGTNTPDTFTLPGTILARAGISGGPVIDSWGKVVGIMSTSTREDSTAERTLRAISLDYINRDINTNHSFSLTDLFSASIASLDASSASTMYARGVLQKLYPF